MRRASGPSVVALALLLGAPLGCVAPPTAPDPAALVTPAEPRSLGNVPFWTFGGKQGWADELWEAGWRIQKSVVTGHCRLLDPHDVRRGWGNYAGCAETLAHFRDQGQGRTCRAARRGPPARRVARRPRGRRGA